MTFTLNTTEILAEIRAKAAAIEGHVFHSPLALYVLVEKKPLPNNPDWIEVVCWSQNDVTGMMVYLSPIDARIGLEECNRGGSKYAIFPFDAIDPRPFIQESGGWLTVYFVYGFAARSQRLVVGKDGELLPLTKAIHFQVTPDMEEHFHLDFRADFLAWLERLHANAGMYDYGRIVHELANGPLAEIDESAREALQCVKQPDSGRLDNITGCGLYDPIERQWRFASFADMAS